MWLLCHSHRRSRQLWTLRHVSGRCCGAAVGEPLNHTSGWSSGRENSGSSGIFLHRAELAASWDLSVFLDVPFPETTRRMAIRDGTHHDPEHPSMHRYVQAQRHYFQECRPQQRSTILIDNSEYAAPVVLRG